MSTAPDLCDYFSSELPTPKSHDGMTYSAAGQAADDESKMKNKQKSRTGCRTCKLRRVRTRCRSRSTADADTLVRQHGKPHGEPERSTDQLDSSGVTRPSPDAGTALRRGLTARATNSASSGPPSTRNRRRQGPAVRPTSPSSSPLLPSPSLSRGPPTLPRTLTATKPRHCP